MNTHNILAKQIFFFLMLSMFFWQMSAYELKKRRPAGDPQGQDEDWSQPC